MKRMTEEVFLDNQLDRQVVVFLLNGIKLQDCVLAAHDNEVIFLRPSSAPGGVMHMVSKCAISTIVSTTAAEGA
jgi:sRNA-binding regulator protein Hfq